MIGSHSRPGGGGDFSASLTRWLASTLILFRRLYWSHSSPGTSIVSQPSKTMHRRRACARHGVPPHADPHGREGNILANKELIAGPCTASRCDTMRSRTTFSQAPCPRRYGSGGPGRWRVQRVQRPTSPTICRQHSEREGFMVRRPSSLLRPLPRRRHRSRL